MILSSDEIRSKSFTVERKGYDKGEVDAFMERVADTVSQLIDTERTLRQQLASTEPGSESVSAAPTTASPDDFAAVGEEVTAVLRTARESADAMRSAAETEAAQIRRDAQSFADQHRSEAETEATTLRSEAAVAVLALREEATRDRGEAQTLLAEARESAATIRSDAETRASQVVSDAEQRAADLVAEATQSAESQYEEAIEEAKQRLGEAQGAEQEVLHALTAAHSDVGAAIARLDRSPSSDLPDTPQLPLSDFDGDPGDVDEAAPVPRPGDPVATTIDSAATPLDTDESEIERTSRQVTGGLAESLRERAGVSGPVGALFGLSAEDDPSGDDTQEGEHVAPSAPETIDLRDRPEGMTGLTGSDDPLADLVKQAVGKAVDRAADQVPEQD